MKSSPVAKEIALTLAGRREWMGLAVLALPTLLVSMDMTVMYLVVPAISEQLRPGGAELLWVTDIYGFFEASMLITMGTLGDRIGRRKLLFIGGSAFALASLAAAFSQSIGQLIIARAVLGVAGASLLPSTLSLIRNLFHDPRQRTKALGVFTAIFSGGTMLGPLVGGLLLERFGWGSVFIIAVPVMLIFLIAAPFLLPEFKDPRPGSFDLLSAGLSIAAVLPLIYGIKRWAEEGSSSLNFILIAAGLILVFVFIRRQKRLKHPLIDIRLFNIPVFSITLVAMLVGIFAWAGIFLFIAQQLQLVFEMSAFQAGLWTIFGAIGSLITCSFASRLTNYFNRVALLAMGIATMAAGFLLLYFAGSQMPLAVLVIAIVLISAGCGLSVTLGHDIIMSNATPQQAGAVASLTETSTTFGGALGIALLGSLGTVLFRERILQAGLPSTELESLKSTLGGTLAATDATLKPGLALVAREAFSYSFTVVSGCCGLLLVMLAVILFWRRNH